MSKHDDALRWLGRGLHALGALVACGLLIAGWMQVRWIRAQAENMRHLSGEAGACIAREEEIRADFNRVRQELESATQVTKSLEDRLPDGPQEARLIAALSQSTRTTGLEINRFHPQRKAEHDAIGALELRLSCEGTYESLCAFLAELQHLSRACHVGRFDISLMNETGEQLRAELEVCAPFKTSFQRSLMRAEINHAAKQH
jgi:Tfp pilus assembly protein PilO